MAAIWPDRFVAESNLTKHIWTLRQALGESEEGGSFIETLPKLGYRFLAPVSRAQVAGFEPPAPVVPARPGADRTDLLATTIADTSVLSWWRRLKPFYAVAAVVSILAIAAVAAWWMWNGREPVFPWSHRAPGTAVAVFDFDNLSRDAKQAWIGPAFSEMLDVEMAQGSHLHLLPGELITRCAATLQDRVRMGFRLARWHNCIGSWRSTIL